jgi:hypothetical protein
MNEPTSNIDFQQFERECGYNTRAREEGSRSPRIYDWRVIIDGEHRATLQRRTVGMGYELYDAESRPINDPAFTSYPHLAMRVDKQADFLEFVRGQLHRIPTIARMAELREIEAKAKAQLEADARAAVVKRHIESHSVELLASLKDLLGCFDDGELSGGRLALVTALDRAGDAVNFCETMPEHFEASVEQTRLNMERS